DVRAGDCIVSDALHSRSGVILCEAGDENHVTVVERDQLRAFDLSELAWRGEGRVNLPLDQVGRAGVRENTGAVGRPLARSRSDQHADVAGRVDEQPGVAPR